jgi:hypothetical protein
MLARDCGWSTTWELRMVKSRAEMMELVGRLLAEYAEFQRGRPDLPQGDLLGPVGRRIGDPRRRIPARQGD